MELAIDIGNSNVVIGAHDGTDWRHFWRLPTLTEEKPALQYYQKHLSNLLLEEGLLPQAIHQSVLSSVVPHLRPVFRQLITQLTGREPITLGPEIYPKLGLTIKQTNEIGTDLVANALAAVYLHQTDSIIVDFGTALTFTTVSKEGKMLGVAIAPGLKTAIGALFQKTAQLPEVPLKVPESVLGADTVHAIQAGILHGYAGMVRHLLEKTRAEAGMQYQAIATGGLAYLMAPLIGEFTSVDERLTINGLRKVAELVA